MVLIRCYYLVSMISNEKRHFYSKMELITNESVQSRLFQTWGNINKRPDMTVFNQLKAQPLKKQAMINNTVKTLHGMA